jgi:hypothetical protein
MFDFRNQTVLKKGGIRHSPDTVLKTQTAQIPLTSHQIQSLHLKH